MLRQDSLMPSSAYHRSESLAKQNPTEPIVQNIRRIFESVFPHAREASDRGDQFALPHGYTSLQEKLPKKQDPNEWSDVVIRSLFDTMAMPPTTYGFRYGSPEQNILMALKSEASNPARVLAFKVLQTKLRVLAQEVGSLKIHSHHRDRVLHMIGEIRSICESL